MAEKGNVMEVEDLKKILKIFSGNWYLFIIFPVIAAAISYFYTHRLTDIYAARTQILLKADDIFKFQGGSGNIYSSFENSTSQIRVMKSSDLIEKVISKLDVDVSYYIIGRFKISEIYQNMPFKVESHNFGSSCFGKEFRINLVDTHKFRMSYLKGDDEITKEYLFGDIILDNGFYFKVNKSGNLNERSVEYLGKINYMFKIHNRNQLVSRYKNRLTVKNLEWTSILEATVEDEIPDRAVAFLDTLSSVFIENTLLSKYNVNTNTLNYIDIQLDELSKIIHEIEEELERFKAAREIVDFSREETETYSKLNSLESQIVQWQTKLKSINELREFILQNNNEKYLPPSFYILAQDEFLRGSVSKLYNLQVEKDEVLTFRGTQKVLGIQQMDSTFEQIRTDIFIYLMNTEKFIEKNMKEANDQIAQLKETIKYYPKTQKQIAAIEQKLNINRSQYQYLLTKRAETILSRASIIPETKVIERARSVGVVKPNKQKISTQFLAGGLIIALIISVIRFFFFVKYDNIRELSKITKIPVLGGLPFNEKGKEQYILVDSEPKGAITEAFRTVRTNMQYLSPEKKSKIVLVTSLHPGEGKTFCSTNLAVIIAKANKKVLLIDLDLHRPKVHKSLNADSSVGISTYLIGKQNYEEAKIPSAYENLDVIFSGPTPPNASELILSEGIVKLIELAKKEYDYIIIDTPPLGLISDAVVLMNFADTVLFIMNSKVATRQGLNYIEEIVKKGNVKSSGIILNEIKNKNWKYYYSGYSYSYAYNYGYGYGYGENGKNENSKEARKTVK